MLELKNISFYYTNLLNNKKKCIFSNLTVRIDKGITAIYGENGEGKTTFAKILCGFLVPQKGEVIFRDKKIDYKNFPYNKFSLFTNYNRAFYWQLNVYENLSFFGFNDKEKIKELSNEINLKEEFLSYKFQELSSGNKAKAVLLKVFLEDRDVVVLDDLSSNIDAKSIEKIKNLIKSIKDKKYIVITTSNPNDYNEISDNKFEISKWKN